MWTFTRPHFAKKSLFGLQSLKSCAQSISPGLRERAFNSKKPVGRAFKGIRMELLDELFCRLSGCLNQARNPVERPSKA